MNQAGRQCKLTRIDKREREPVCVKVVSVYVCVRTCMSVCVSANSYVCVVCVWKGEEEFPTLIHSLIFF